MSIRGEIPFPEPEYALSPEAILAFRDQIIWPAIDALTPNNIITEAPPGSKASYDYTFPYPMGTLQVKMIARAWMAPDDDGAMVRQAGCELNLKMIDGEITPGTLEVAEIDEEDRNFLFAWRTKTYRFSTDPTRPYSQNSGVEVQDIADEDESVLWTDSELPQYCVGDEDNVSMLGAEDTMLCRLFTNYDVERIKIALADIGVPLALLGIPLAEEGIIVVDPPGTGVDG